MFKHCCLALFHKISKTTEYGHLVHGLNVSSPDLETAAPSTLSMFTVKQFADTVSRLPALWNIDLGNLHLSAPIAATPAAFAWPHSLDDTAFNRAGFSRNEAHRQALHNVLSQRDCLSRARAFIVHV